MRIGRERREATLYARITPTNKKFLGMGFKRHGFISEADFVDSIITYYRTVLEKVEDASNPAKSRRRK